MQASGWSNPATYQSRFKLLPLLLLYSMSTRRPKRSSKGISFIFGSSIWMIGAFQWVCRLYFGWSWFLPPVIVSAASYGMSVLSSSQDVFNTLAAGTGGIGQGLFTGRFKSLAGVSIRQLHTPPAKQVVLCFARLCSWPQELQRTQLAKAITKIRSAYTAVDKPD